MTVQLRCVLAIGGLDPGGGAGVLADARAIDSVKGAFACAVIAVQTVQSTNGLVRTQNVNSKLWLEQARDVLAHQRVCAIKTGALGDDENVRAMTKLARTHSQIPLVVDPVMSPTRGRARLLDERALAAMRVLISHSTIVTANADEAGSLVKMGVKNVQDARIAARALTAMGARAALVKGGHLADESAVDVLVIRDRTFEIAAPRLRFSKRIHGGGCALASLIAAHLTTGASTLQAVRKSKRIHHAALARAADVGGSLHVMRF